MAKYIPTCQVCGNPVPQGGTFQQSPPYLFLCDQCASQFWTCFSCTHGEKCGFQENPDGILQVVMQTVRQGNMVLQQQVMNPELVARTCQAGCHCYIDGNCLKHTLGSCERYELAASYVEQTQTTQEYSQE